MMTSSNRNIFRVTGHLCGEFTGPGEFPAQTPVTRSFDVFFDLRLNKRLSKQWWGWWFETLSHPLWRHRNVADIFKCILLNENVWISIEFSLKFVPWGIDNKPSLVEIMAWRQGGDKPLSQPMMVSLLTHICVAQLQWVKWRKSTVLVWNSLISNNT